MTSRLSLSHCTDGLLALAALGNTSVERAWTAGKGCRAVERHYSRARSQFTYRPSSSYRKGKLLKQSPATPSRSPSAALRIPKHVPPVCIFQLTPRTTITQSIQSVSCCPRAHASRKRGESHTHHAHTWRLTAIFAQRSPPTEKASNTCYQGLLAQTNSGELDLSILYLGQPPEPCQLNAGGPYHDSVADAATGSYHQRSL